MLMRLSNGFGLGMGMVVVSILFSFVFFCFLLFSFLDLRRVENIGPVRLTWKRYIR